MRLILFPKGQFVSVVGYPCFIHLLDVRVGHEPIDRLLLVWSSLPMSLPSSLNNFMRIFSDTGARPVLNCSSTLTLVYKGRSNTDIEIIIIITLSLQITHPNFARSETGY